MTRATSGRLVLLLWFVVLAASIVFAIETIGEVLREGIVSPRPPLSAFQTGFRIALVVGAAGLLFVLRHPLERVTLLVAVAAAGASAFYGFGVRSSFLVAFRLLSHLGLYLLAVVVASRRVFAPRRKPET